jgi:hypothetical protein
MLITRKSALSGKTRTLDLNVEQHEIDLWTMGTVIQKAMPRLTADEREFIMTGITAEEWDSMFADEEK